MSAMKYTAWNVAGRPIECSGGLRIEEPAAKTYPIDAIQRAYANDGARLPGTIRTVWRLRQDLRLWKAACFALAAAATVEGFALLLAVSR